MWSAARGRPEVIGLDTNVLLRYVLRDDPVQAARADREIERGDRFLIDGIVLCELVWVLESGYGFERSEIAAALDRILATAQFEIEGKEVAQAALGDFRRRRGLLGLSHRAPEPRVGSGRDRDVRSQLEEDLRGSASSEAEPDWVNLQVDKGPSRARPSRRAADHVSSLRESPALV